MGWDPVYSCPAFLWILLELKSFCVVRVAYSLLLIVGGIDRKIFQTSVTESALRAFQHFWKQELTKQSIFGGNIFYSSKYPSWFSPRQQLNSTQPFTYFSHSAMRERIGRVIISRGEFKYNCNTVCLWGSHSGPKVHKMWHIRSWWSWRLYCRTWFHLSSDIPDKKSQWEFSCALQLKDCRLNWSQA